MKKKYDFEQGSAIRYSTQNLCLKNANSGKAVGRSAALATVNIPLPRSSTQLHDVL